MYFDPANGGSAAGDTLVRLDRVSKSYGNSFALRDLSLDIQRGEFLTLLGPSGCGKTTTLRLISGFEVPDRGSVSISGRDVTDVPPFRRNVNTVFQNYALFPHLTVFENVAYALRVKRLAASLVRSKVSVMLDRVGLSDKAGQYPRQLSGGQMQRVALGRALINEPAVLLLDEPLSALDAKLRRAMQLELRRIHSELGLTFVCVTHDQEEALAMSDRIAVLDSGQIAQIGTPQQIFERPSNRFVADFIGGCNFIPAFVDPSGEFSIPASNAAAPARNNAGKPVVLAVRPQTLKFGAPEASAAFNVTVRVSDIVYLGTSVRVVLTLGDGAGMTADVDRKIAERLGLAAASFVQVWACREDLMVFDNAAGSGHGA